MADDDGIRIIYVRWPELHKLRVIIPGERFMRRTGSWTLSDDGFGRSSVELVITLGEQYPDWVEPIKNGDKVTWSFSTVPTAVYNVLQVSGDHAWIKREQGIVSNPVTVNLSEIRKVPPL